jgi:hypothetical protein
LSTNNYTTRSTIFRETTGILLWTEYNLFILDKLKLFHIPSRKQKGAPGFPEAPKTINIKIITSHPSRPA